MGPLAGRLGATSTERVKRTAGGLARGGRVDQPAGWHGPPREEAVRKGPRLDCWRAKRDRTTWNPLEPRASGLAWPTPTRSPPPIATHLASTSAARFRGNVWDTSGPTFPTHARVAGVPEQTRPIGTRTARLPSILMPPPLTLAAPHTPGYPFPDPAPPTLFLSASLEATYIRRVPSCGNEPSPADTTGRTASAFHVACPSRSGSVMQPRVTQP